MFFCLSENRSLFFEIKRISEVAEIGVYGIDANYHIHFVEKKKETTESHFHYNRHADMQRSQLLVCWCCCQCCCLIYPKRFVVKSVAEELATQFYSDVKGSNPISP